jgi:hypothetical protein
VTQTRRFTLCDEIRPIAEALFDLAIKLAELSQDNTSIPYVRLVITAARCLRVATALQNSANWFLSGKRQQGMLRSYYVPSKWGDAKSCSRQHNLVQT